MTSDQPSVSDQVRRIRCGILARHGYDPESGTQPALPSQSALEEATSLMQVSAHWGIASEIPVFGRLLVLVRRTIRIGLRWYINPLVDQQNAFNQAMVKALYELRSENDELRARLEDANQPDPSGRQDRG